MSYKYKILRLNKFPICEEISPFNSFRCKSNRFKLVIEKISNGISAERLFTLLEKGKIGQMKEEFDKFKQLADIDENGMLNYRELAKKFLKEKDNI